MLVPVTPPELFVTEVTDGALANTRSGNWVLTSPVYNSAIGLVCDDVACADGQWGLDGKGAFDNGDDGSVFLTVACDGLKMGLSHPRWGSFEISRSSVRGGLCRFGKWQKDIGVKKDGRRVVGSSGNRGSDIPFVPAVHYESTDCISSTVVDTYRVRKCYRGLFLVA